MENEIETCRKIVEACRNEARKRLVGQDKLIDDILIAIVAGGLHVGRIVGL